MLNPIGRLAQLGEHLVYIQGVGGSSPSPPIASHDPEVSDRGEEQG